VFESIVNTMKNISRKISLKLIILGDPRVGKTSLVNKYMGNEFSKRYQKTFGSDISFKHVDYTDSDNNTYKISYSIWDIYGEVTCAELVKQYLIGTQAIIFIYDIENLDSYNNINEWFSKASKTLELKNIPIILVGNKIDLRSEININEVSAEKGIELFNALTDKYTLKNKHFHFIETSALTGKNISKVFELLSETIIKAFFTNR